MFCFRLFFYSILLTSFPLFAFANIEKINSIIHVRNKVESLLADGVKPEDILVGWDCHGVVTAQGTPRKDIEMTLNPNVLDVLAFLDASKIPQFIATAWNNPYDVQEDLIRLKVASYFDDGNRGNEGFQVANLGKDKSIALEGYKIGRVTALRYRELSNTYFRQKAFGGEWCFPEKNFKHIIFTDDDMRNLELFKNDFNNTIYYNSEEDMKKLTLYHFSCPELEAMPRYAIFPRNSSSDGEEDDEF